MTRVAELPISEPLRFLQALYPELPEGAALLLWTLPDKRSAFYSEVGDAARSAIKAAPSRDVYFGVGLRAPGTAKRGGNASIVAMPALFADFDIRPNRPGSVLQYPDDEGAVRRILAELPLAPSALVHSGGGVHAYWIFHELEELENGEDRDRFAALSKGWNELIRARAEGLGLAVDAVHDLARVLRLPGTVNHKGGNERPVRLLELEPRRYSPGDFDDFARTELRSARAGIGPFILDPNASPPPHKLEALLEIEPRFKPTFERKRRDFTDQSPSAYDMSLATFAAGAGWTDQEIVDLLIAHRREQGSPLKLREDYYKLTLERARESVTSDEIASELELELERARRRENEAPPPAPAPPAASSDEPGAEPAAPAEPAPPAAPAPIPLRPETREGGLAMLEQVTGLPVARIVAHGTRGAHYEIVLRDGRSVFMGGTDNFISFSAWWNAAFEITRRAPTARPKQAKWTKVLALIQPLIENSDADDAEEVSVLLEHLRRYLSRSADLSGVVGTERGDAIRDGRPFLDAGVYYFQVVGLYEYLALQREKVDRRALVVLLKAAGCEHDKLQARASSGPVKRSYWRVAASRIEE